MPSTRLTHKSSKFSSGRLKRDSKQPSLLRASEGQTKVSMVVSPPHSPPATRLRRLGVRQIDDDHAASSDMDPYTDSGQGNITPVLQSNLNSPSDSPVDGRQLKRIHKRSNEVLISSINPLGRTKVLSCPVCHKVFLSFHGHDLHLEKHKGAAIKCWHCNLRFCSNKSLVQHQRLRHNKRRQAEEMAGRGFHNLVFIDFSCDKFPAISQRYCEKNSVQAACHIHDYSCSQCSKSFPSPMSLELHVSSFHYFPSKHICLHCNHDYKTKAQLEKHKNRYADSLTKKIYLTDSKRRFLRALGLMPLCAASTHDACFRTKQSPKVNADYYHKLREIDTVTRLSYDVHEEPEQDDDESDSTNS